MNKEIADRWVEALTSGKYKQATATLRTNEGMCCLGVLCDLYDPTKWIDPIQGNNMFGYHNQDKTPEFGVLTHEVRIWAGMKTLGAELRYDGQAEQLSSLNDSGKTFAEIAEIISDHWKDL